MKFAHEPISIRRRIVTGEQKVKSEHEQAVPPKRESACFIAYGLKKLQGGVAWTLTLKGRTLALFCFSRNFTHLYGRYQKQGHPHCTGDLVFLHGRVICSM